MRQCRRAILAGKILVAEWAQTPKTSSTVYRLTILSTPFKLGPGGRGVVGIHGMVNNGYYAHYVNAAGGKNGPFLVDGTRNGIGYLNGSGHNILTAPPYASPDSTYGFIKSGGR